MCIRDRSEEIKSWVPSYENYILTRTAENHTIFEIDMDVTDDYYDMFMRLWPLALQELKSTAENMNVH